MEGWRPYFKDARLIKNHGFPSALLVGPDLFVKRRIIIVGGWFFRNFHRPSLTVIVSFDQGFKTVQKVNHIWEMTYCVYLAPMQKSILFHNTPIHTQLK